jgi:hypothetical protein
MSGPGNDVMDGGSGTDGVSYHRSLEPVTALLFTNTGGRSYDSDTYLRPWRTFPAAATIFSTHRAGSRRS